MKKLRTGVIGCGKVSHTHAQALCELKESEFVAAYSRAPDKAAAFAEPYRARGFADLEAMLKEVDALVVCTPHPFHVEPTVRALQAGVHVLVEKPLAASLQDCDRTPSRLSGGCYQVLNVPVRCGQALSGACAARDHDDHGGCRGRRRQDGTDR